MGNLFATYDLSNPKELQQAIYRTETRQEFEELVDNYVINNGKSIKFTVGLFIDAVRVGKLDIAECVLRQCHNEVYLTNYNETLRYIYTFDSYKTINAMVKTYVKNFQPNPLHDMLVITLAGNTHIDVPKAIIAEYKIDTSKINDTLKFKITDNCISAVIEIKEGKETLTSTIDYCHSYGLYDIFKTYFAGKKQSKDTYKTLLCHSHNRLLETLIINEIDKHLYPSDVNEILTKFNALKLAQRL
jgi:hypothetical protein